MFANALHGKPAQVLGNPDLPHTVTYIDDFARALVTLAERHEALGQVWHVPNDETVTTRRFVETVFTAVGGKAALKAAARVGFDLGRNIQPYDPRCKRTATSNRAALGRRQLQV